MRSQSEVMPLQAPPSDFGLKLGSVPSGRVAGKALPRAAKFPWV